VTFVDKRIFEGDGTMAKLEQLLQEVRAQLGGDFVSTDIVGMDGISIAGGSVSPEFDSTEASARFAMVMKLAAQVSNKIGMGGVDDLLVTTDKVFILTRFLGNGTYYWGLAVSRNATLGSVRILMNEYADQLWDAIPTR
jgi:predicted regulator of Ras-like GTPase activity (Roadblock/LC7/MglB family)